VVIGLLVFVPHLWALLPQALRLIGR
jgi:hypothetical protein